MGYSAPMASHSAAMPAPVLADTASTLPNRFSSAALSSTQGRSLLFTTTSRWDALSATAMASSSCCSSGTEPSSSSSARDARCAALRLRSTPSRSTASPVSRMPAVSVSRSST